MYIVQVFFVLVILANWNGFHKKYIMLGYLRFVSFCCSGKSFRFSVDQNPVNWTELL